MNKTIDCEDTLTAKGTVASKNIILDNSKDRIIRFLNLVDDQFHVKLSERVNIEDYSTKLSKAAMNYYLVIDEKDVGHLGFYVNKSDGFLFISSIALMKDFEGRGLAGKLIGFLKDYAVNLQIYKVSLHVHKEASNVVRFYKKHGFVITNDNKDNYVMSCEIKCINNEI